MTGWELAAVAALSYVAWFRYFIRGSYARVGVEGARRLIEEKRPFICDVRSSHEQAQGIIPGAVCLPLAELEQRIAEVPQDRPILIYCASGMRSLRAASILSRRGYRDVVNLTGGIAAWTAAGHPVAKP